MSLPLYQVDAFTSTAFAGNPAGVCFLDAPRDSAWMQSVAAEMNLAETAFLLKEPGGYNIRWMTPTVEVDLCGHATIASVAVLDREGLLDNGAVKFSSRSGVLTATRVGDAYELDFPAKPAAAAPALTSAIRALGLMDNEVRFFGRNAFDFVVEVESESVVRRLKPEFVSLSTLDVRGIVVTSKADAGHDYQIVSRGFFPGSGINEDPVTGSAHAMLAPYWAPTLGTNTIRAFQASQRGGYLDLTLEGDRVKMRGNAVIVFKGELLV